MLHWWMLHQPLNHLTVNYITISCSNRTPLMGSHFWICTRVPRIGWIYLGHFVSARVCIWCSIYHMMLFWAVAQFKLHSQICKNKFIQDLRCTQTYQIQMTAVLVIFTCLKMLLWMWQEWPTITLWAPAPAPHKAHETYKANPYIQNIPNIQHPEQQQVSANFKQFNSTCYRQQFSMLHIKLYRFPLVYTTFTLFTVLLPTFFP
jgi:hypothetical protein